MKELQLTQTRTESQPAELPIASVKGHGLQSEPAQGFVSRGTESDNSDLKEFEIIPPSGKNIRQYQTELATPGIQGKNCIVVAPTGTGKTLVACMIICANLNHYGRRGKVLFLVPKTPLADQQKEKLTYHITGAEVMSLTGDSSSTFALSSLLQKNNIVVCTPQILINNLESDSVQLENISLIVFDECHHCKGQAPYATIMIMYLRKKLRKGETWLPQIVGLTASPGAGDSRKPDLMKTIDHLTTLGALMDADAGYITVKENLAELHQFTSKTEFAKVPMPGRISDDDFQSLLYKYIKQLDEIVQNITGKSTHRCYIHQGYINFLSELLSDSKLRSDKPELERSIRAILEHLQHYVKILHYYNDYEFEDSLSVKFSKLRKPDADKMIRVEKQLWDLLEQFQQDVQQITGSVNPKLVQLKKLLQDGFQCKDSKAIVFVTEVESAFKMMEWIKRQPELESIQPDIVVGSGHETRPMSDAERQHRIKSFREGRLNLLVATSVLEEGIDVPACNLVIRYQHVTNEISLVQSKGRARSMHSKCYAIVGKGTPKEFQELQNEEKNHLVDNVIENHLPSESQWSLKIHKFQSKILDEVELEEKFLVERKKANDLSSVHLICSTCDTLACYGEEIYIHEKQYVVISDEIHEKYVSRSHEKPIIKSNLEVRNRLHCKQCDQRWGVVSHWPKRSQTFPCISCEKFIFVIKGQRHTFRKWKDVTFPVKDLKDYEPSKK
ncbi:antiviral innate immune response receptor RIG-I-like isoform X2 [Dysidea avara]